MEISRPWKFPWPQKKQSPWKFPSPMENSMAHGNFHARPNVRLDSRCVAIHQHLIMCKVLLTQCSPSWNSWNWIEEVITASIRPPLPESSTDNNMLQKGIFHERFNELQMYLLIAKSNVS